MRPPGVSITVSDLVPNRSIFAESDLISLTLVATKLDWEDFAPRGSIGNSIVG
jgi:hypothetical protein